MSSLNVWLSLTLTIALLLWVSHNFTRRTLRITSMVVAVIWATLLTGHGGKKGAEDFGDAFYRGSLEAIQAFFTPLFKLFNAAPPETDLPGILTAVAVVLVSFALLDTHAARRDPPVLQLTDIGESGPQCKEIAESLRLQLPAIQVKKPPLLPGGSSMESLATVAESFEADSGKVFGAIVRMIKTLEAKPRILTVNLLTEKRVEKDGGPHKTIATVDLWDMGTGNSLVVKTFLMDKPELTAERIAAFIARHAMLCNPAIPTWMVGSFDGEDLAAYVAEKKICIPVTSREDARRIRSQRRDVLAGAVQTSPNAGIVHYELALLYDIDGENVEPVRLHLQNRMQHPTFLRGRYRLALSLCMLAAKGVFENQWNATSTLTESRLEREAQHRDIAEAIRSAGLASDPRFLREVQQGKGGDPLTIRRGFLCIARDEYVNFRKSLRLGNIMCRATANRDARESALYYLTNWRARKDMIKMAKTGEMIACSRDREITEWAPCAMGKLEEARRRGLSFISKTGIDVDPKFTSDCVQDQKTHTSHEVWRKYGPRWELVYNVACLFAIPPPGAELSVADEGKVVRLLRHAISDPSCNLTFPSEWLDMDPDLRHLRRSGTSPFPSFLREMEERDFAHRSKSSGGASGRQENSRNALRKGPRRSQRPRHGRR